MKLLCPNFGAASVRPNNSNFFSRWLACWLGVALLLGLPISSWAATSYISANLTNLTAALTNGGAQVIVFTNDGNITVTQSVYISRDITIDGGSGKVTITSKASSTNAPAFRIFNIATGGTLRLRNLTLSGAQDVSAGAIYNQGTLSMSNVVVSGNKGVGAAGAAGAVGADGSTGGTGVAGGNGASSYGGAINNAGTAILLNCVLTNNSATGGAGGTGGTGGVSTTGWLGGYGGRGGNGGAAYGGAIFNSSGSVYLTNCVIAKNTVTGGAGGAGGAGGTGTFAGWPGNGGAGAEAFGGGIYSASGQIFVSGCTFMDDVVTAGNSAAAGTSSSNNNGNDGYAGGNAAGAGIYSLGKVVVINSTFYYEAVTGGNAGAGGPGDWMGGNGGNGGYARGGSIYNAGQAYVTNATFYAGSALGGLGGTNGTGTRPGTAGSEGVSAGANIDNNGGTFVLINSIIYSTNQSVANCSGYFTDSYNISSDGTPSPSGNGTRLWTDPKLNTSLVADGSPTFTVPVLSNSPAIYGGDPSFHLPIDQRGALRTNYPTIGACEFGRRPVVKSPTNEMNVLEGSTVTLRPGVYGDIYGLVKPSEPATYEWWFNPASNVWNKLSITDQITNVSTNTLVITNFTATNAGGYSLVVKNPYGSAACPTFKVLIGTGVTIDTQPTNVTTLPGTNVLVEFNVHAVGTPTLTYQWVHNGTNFLDCTSNKLCITNVQASHGGNYTVIVANGFGAVTSQVASLVVATGPTSASIQPASQTVVCGNSAQFTASSDGTGPFHYQWRFNGQNIANSDTNKLTVPQLAFANAGNYDVIVTSAYGAVTSQVAQLTVTLAVGGRILQGLQPVAGVTVQVGDTTVTTDGNGYYFLSGVASGDILVMPTKASYRFSPQFYSFSLTAPSTNLNFDAVVDGYSISGRVVQTNGAGFPGVTLHASASGANFTTISDNSGYFTFTNLVPGTWSVVASLAGYSFSPPESSVTINSSVGSSANVNFTGYITYSIMGHIYWENSNGLAGVTVMATNATTNITTRSSSGGMYGFANLVPGTYQVSIASPYSDKGVGFTPSGYTVTVGPDRQNADFVANASQLTISKAQNVEVTVKGVPNHNYYIWASTNATDWSKILTNTLPEGTLTYEETNGLPFRFYRFSR